MLDFCYKCGIISSQEGRSPACAAHWVLPGFAALCSQAQSSAAAEKVPVAERDFRSVFELFGHWSK